MKIVQKTFLCMTVMMTFGMLSGCEKETKESTSSYALPEGMQDCRIYQMQGQNGESMTVVRCPLSSTTTDYHSGKTTRSVSVLEMAPKENAPASAPVVKKGETTDEIEINGETYRQTDSMKEIQINGKSYKKVQ